MPLPCTNSWLWTPWKPPWLAASFSLNMW
jgi:hypothetical protein